MANELSDLHPIPGSQQARTRIGRGQGSGLGKTSGRGQKGQKARAGSNKGNGFEGGQVPLKRRLPKYGFRNYSVKDFAELNVGQLGVFEAGTVVDPHLLKQTGVISRIGRDGVKLLGMGELNVALTLRGVRCSASARDKVTAAGGTVEAVDKASAEDAS